MNKSESIAALAQALCKAQSEIKPAQMNSINPFLKNRYADLGAVIEAARAPLSKNGLGYTQLVSGDGKTIAVETVLVHFSGEWMSDTISLPVGEEKGRSLAQGAGSIITYLRRYSLAALLGIYSDEDSDGGQAAKPAPKPESQPQPANGNGSKPAAPAPKSITVRDALGLNTAKGTKLADCTPAQLKILTEKADGDLQAGAKLLLAPADPDAWARWYKLVEEAAAHNITAADVPDKAETITLIKAAWRLEEALDKEVALP